MFRLNAMETRTRLQTVVQKGKMGGSAMRKLAPLAVVVVLVLACAASANLLVNPGFETGTTGGDNGLFGTAGGNLYAPGYWSQNSLSIENYAAHSGSNGVSFHNWWNGAWGYFGQEILTNSVIGDVVTFKAYGLFEANYTSSTKETWMQVEFWQGGVLAGSQQYSVYDTLAASRGTWNQLTVLATNTYSGVTLIKTMIGYGQGTNLGLGSSAGWFDDLDTTVAIPEPTMAALLGFSGLIFLAARRMVRK
jgi:hypothetical protein